MIEAVYTLVVTGRLDLPVVRTRSGAFLSMNLQQNASRCSYRHRRTHNYSPANRCRMPSAKTGFGRYRPASVRQDKTPQPARLTGPKSRASAVVPYRAPTKRTVRVRVLVLSVVWYYYVTVSVPEQVGGISMFCQDDHLESVCHSAVISVHTSEGQARHTRGLGFEEVGAV